MPWNVTSLLLWVCPLMSVSVATITYSTALGYEVNVPFWAVMIVGSLIGVVLAMLLYSYFYYLKHNQDEDY